jgi:hypothetical protein
VFDEPTQTVSNTLSTEALKIIKRKMPKSLRTYRKSKFRGKGDTSC